MAIKTRRAQALVELAVGMLALALVLASLIGFTSVIVGSLDMQRSLRVDAGKTALNAPGGDDVFSSNKEHDTVVVEPFAAEYIFGDTRVPVKEEVHLPAMAGLEQQ